MLDESIKAFILEVMDRKLCAISNGDESGGHGGGFATSSDIELRGMHFANICAGHNISFSDFEESRKDDPDFDAKCSARERQIAKMLVGTAMEAAFRASDPKQIVAVAERLDKDFAPVARSHTNIIGTQNNNMIQAFLEGRNGAEVKRAMEFLEGVEQRRSESRYKADAAIRAIEAIEAVEADPEILG